MSFATLALWVAGAGVLGLALTAVLVGVLPLSPAGRAGGALAGVVPTIAAMGVPSNRTTDRAIRAEYGGEPADGVGDDDDTGRDGLG